MFFSIIVPVYNVEPYLRQAVDSALHQDFTGNYEIILIDDGSTDNSGKICDEYASAHLNIRVIHKQNGGLSSARNAGLDIAKGEYVVFLDSDDWLELDALSSFYKVLKDNSCEILSFLVSLVFPDSGKINPISTDGLSEGFYEIPFALQKRKLWTSANLYVFSKSIFRSFRFEEGRIFEDSIFLTQFFCRTTSDIYMLNYIGYNYRQREGSIMNGNNTEDFLKRIDASYYLSKIIEEEIISLSPDDYRRVYFKNKIAENLSEYLASVVYGMHRGNILKKTTRKAIYQDLRRKKMFALKDKNYSQRLITFLFRLGLPFFIFLFSIKIINIFFGIYPRFRRKVA